MNSRKKCQMLAALAAALMIASVAQADTILQTVNNIGWTEAVWGSPAAVPTAGNDYVMVGTLGSPSTLRGLNNGENFAGNSFTVDNNCKWLNKAKGALIKIKDGSGSVICNQGAHIQCAPNWGGGTGAPTTWDCGDFVVNGYTLMYTNNELTQFRIAGTLTGAGDIRIQTEGDNAGGNGSIWTFEAVSGYTGTITVGNPMILDFDSTVRLAGGIVLEAAAGGAAGRINVDQMINVSEGQLVVNGVIVPLGSYSGAALADLNTTLGGTYFIDGGGMLNISAKGAAINPTPSVGATEVPVNQVFSWEVSNDPDIDLTYTPLFRVYADPNAAKVNSGTGCVYDSTSFAAATSYDPPIDLDLDKQYFWRVDTQLKFSSYAEPNEIKGDIWYFDTPTSIAAANAGTNWITALDILPLAINGSVTEPDSNLINSYWEFLADDTEFPGMPVKECMQMQNRNDYTGDAGYNGLIKDWIGTDDRVLGNPLVLTISGLPAGTYNWLSYHHDTQDQTGKFDLTIVDADGPVTIADLDITNGAAELFETNVTKVAATIVSDGSDVTLVFDQQEWAEVAHAFFVMNGFDLVRVSDSAALKVDFGQGSSPVQPGYVAYTAANEAFNDFGPKPFSAFGTTITVNPDWVGAPVATTFSDDTVNIYNPKATFWTDTIGTYKFRLTAVDPLGETSDLIEVQVLGSACEVAKAKPDYERPAYDFNNDCREDLDDLIMFVGDWLDDAYLTAQETFAGDVNYDPVVQQ